MAGVCLACAHPNVDALNQQLDARTPSVWMLARDYAIPRFQLIWHRRDHMPAVLHGALPTPLTTSEFATVTETRRRQTMVRAQKRFLLAYAQVGVISRACKLAKVSRASIYQWQEHDAEFTVAMREAGITATEALETEAWRRARDGVDEPVYQHSKLVGTITRYSDNLLMFMLRARAPERYRERVDVSVQPVIKAVAGFDPADVV